MNLEGKRIFEVMSKTADVRYIESINEYLIGCFLQSRPGTAIGEI